MDNGASSYRRFLDGDDNSFTEIIKDYYDGKILLLSGEPTQTPLQPKDYPFYYPDEHKRLIDLLKQKAPKAIIAFTGSDELCGLSPFPLFDDGNFSVPSACMSLSLLDTVKRYIGTSVHLSIVSAKHTQKTGKS